VTDFGAQCGALTRSEPEELQQTLTFCTEEELTPTSASGSRKGLAQTQWTVTGTSRKDFPTTLNIVGGGAGAAPTSTPRLKNVNGQ